MPYTTDDDSGARPGRYLQYDVEDFYAPDVASIAAGSPYATDSSVIPVIPADFGRISVYATGADVSAAGAVTFSFACIAGYGATYPTTADFTISVDLNGTTKAVKSESVDLRGMYAIKCIQVDNGDAIYAATVVNAEISHKFARR